MRRLDAWISAFGQWLYDWQTLVGSILALVAAYVAIRITRKQIAEASNFNREQIERAHNAARVVLPLALSALSEKFQQIADTIVREIEVLNEGTSLNEILEVIDLPNDDKSSRFEPIEIDNEVYSAMQRFVETLTLPADIRHTAELLSSIQILLARYRTFDLRQIVVQDALYGLLIDTAKVQLLVDKMFNYVRFVDNRSFGIVGVIDADVAWNEILQKAHGLIFRWPRIDRISQPLGEKVRRYIESKASPWNEKFEAL